MIANDKIARFNKHACMIIATKSRTYYAGVKSVKMNDNRSITFNDMLRDQQVSIAHQGVYEVITFCGWLTKKQWENAGVWFLKNKKNIKTNNTTITSYVKSIKTKCGKFFNPDDKDPLFIQMQDWRAEKSQLQCFVDMSVALDLPKCVVSLAQLETETNIEQVKKKWIEIIHEHRDKAIKVLDNELQIANDENDTEAIDEIKLVKELMKDSVNDVDLSQLTTVKDVLLYWPPLLLPAPDFTFFLRV